MDECHAWAVATRYAAVGVGDVSCYGIVLFGSGVGNDGCIREEQQMVKARHISNGDVCEYAALDEYALLFVEYCAQEVVSVQ